MRHSKELVIGALTALGLVAGAVVVFAPRDPQLGIAPTLELGELNHNQTLDVRIPFRNTGGGGLRIEQVHGGCSCIRTEKPEGEFGPNASGEIRLRFTADLRPGLPIDRIVQVQSNDPRQAWRSVQLKGTMGHFLVASPSEARSRLVVGDTCRQEIAIRATAVNDHPRILNASVDLPEFRCLIVDSESPGEGSTVELRSAPFTKAGVVTGKLTIATNSLRAPLVLVPIHVEVLACVSASPEYLIVRFDSNGKWTGRMRFRARIPVIIRPPAGPIHWVAVDGDGTARENWEFEGRCFADSSIQDGQLRFTVEGDPNASEVTARIAFLEQ